MNKNAKPILALSGTLIIGVLIGFLIAGFFVRTGVRRMMDFRSGEGFKMRIVEITEPDEDQLKAIEAIFEERQEQLSSMRENHRMEFESTMTGIITEVDSVLTPEQSERLHARLQRMKEMGRRFGPGHPRGPRHPKRHNR